MAAHTLDAAKMRRALEAVAKHGGVRPAARALGMAPGTLEHQYKTALRLQASDGQAQQHQIIESMKVTGDTAEMTKATAERVKTLADLIRVCEIDTAEWDVERWVANKWDSAAMLAHKDGSTTPHISELYQIKVWLKRRSPLVLAMEQLRVDLVEDIRREVKRPAPPVPKARRAAGGWLFEFAPFDLHLGKFAWGQETAGADYDSNIAADLFNESLDYLLERAVKFTDDNLERVLCVFGNDVCHVDSKKGQTTAGTQMDFDTRYIKVYRRICEIHRRAIDILRQVAPVDVVIVPGNHDEVTSFHLGEILAARYENDKRVTVDNSPRLRKYYSFGQTLLGFTHGDSERVKELPLLMAREVPELWSKCGEREFHLGHLHISEKYEFRRTGMEKDLISDKGVRVRRLPSMSGHDAWHTRHGYTDRRACESFLFHRDAGYSAQFSFNIDHATGQPMRSKSA